MHGDFCLCAAGGKRPCPLSWSTVRVILMAQKMHCPPSRLIGLDAGSYEAWCVDEAMYFAGVKLQGGAKLKPRKTEDNRELLKRVGL